MVYYEIWKVVDNEIYIDADKELPTDKADDHGYHDRFWWDGAGDDTRGFHVKMGDAVFVRDLRGVQGLTSGNVKEAGILFAVCKLPKPYKAIKKSRVGATAKKYVRRDWVCCPCEKEINTEKHAFTGDPSIKTDPLK